MSTSLLSVTYTAHTVLTWQSTSSLPSSPQVQNQRLTRTCVSWEANRQPSQVAQLTSVKCHNELFYCANEVPEKLSERCPQPVIICSSHCRIINSSLKRPPNLSQVVLCYVQAVDKNPIYSLRNVLFRGLCCGSCLKGHLLYLQGLL